jgi:hypothetical protein
VSRIISFSGEFDLFFLLKCSLFGFRDWRPSGTASKQVENVWL